MAPELVIPDAVDPEVDAPIWRVVVTDMAGAPMGELLDATGRKFSFRLRSPETIEFKLYLNNPLLEELLTPPQMNLFKVYKRQRLVQIFETTSWEFVSTEEGLTTAAFVATSPGWQRLAMRLIGQSRTGASADGDRIAFLANELLALNTISDTKLRMGYQGAGSSVAITGWRYKKFLEAMQELAFTVNGFDFYFTPEEPDTGIVQRLNMAEWWGNPAADVVFDYGHGNAALRDWSWKGSNAKRLNRAVALPASYPENAGLDMVGASDATSQSEIGIREEVVSTDLDDTSLRQLLVNEHVAVRKGAQQIFTFNPHFDDDTGRVPQFLDDYDIGDTITAHIDDNGWIALDGQVRCYGVDIEPSDEGLDTTTLTMVQEEA